jgi:hypothetical protein
LGLALYLVDKDNSHEIEAAEFRPQPGLTAALQLLLGWRSSIAGYIDSMFSMHLAQRPGVRAVPSFELAISQAIYHSKWLLGRFLGLMKGIEGQATETVVHVVVLHS